MLKASFKSPTRPPRHLQQSGRALFRDVQAEYDIRDAAGIALLVCACECLDRVRQAQQAIEKHGPLDIDRYGGARMSPACVLERDARGQFLQAMKSLNLDLEPLKTARERGADPFRRNGSESRVSAPLRSIPTK